MKSSKKVILLNVVVWWFRRTDKAKSMNFLEDLNIDLKCTTVSATEVS